MRKALLRFRMCTGRISTRRKIACLPTIFEVVNEEKAALDDAYGSRLPSRQGLGYKRESKKKRNNKDDLMCTTLGRSLVLRMDIEATKGKLFQCNTHERTSYPDFYPEYPWKTCCSNNISIKSIRVYHQNACSGLCPVKLGGRQAMFEKESGIALWLKFFG